MRWPRPLTHLAMLPCLLLLPAAALADSHGGEETGALAGRLAERLAESDRPEADEARDPGRRPAQVLAFLGVRPGMTALDLIAAGGYYTEVLSVAVGPEGTVYAQNPPRVLAFRDGAYDRALTERLAGDRLPNVRRLDGELAEVDVPPGSVDVALTALNIHDVLHGEGGAQAARGFLARVRELLAPGGVLGIIDHAGEPGRDNASLHRAVEEEVVAAAEEAGFRVEARSDLLRNPEDDRSKRVFDPEIRGRTDRFLLKLRKPR